MRAQGFRVLKKSWQCLLKLIFPPDVSSLRYQDKLTMANNPGNDEIGGDAGNGTLERRTIYVLIYVLWTPENSILSLRYGSWHIARCP